MSSAVGLQTLLAEQFTLGIASYGAPGHVPLPPPWIELVHVQHFGNFYIYIICPVGSGTLVVKNAFFTMLLYTRIQFSFPVYYIYVEIYVISA